MSYLSDSHTTRVAYVILAAASLVLAILTTLGNSLVLRALPKCQALQKSARALLGSLPLSDLGIGLFAYPLLVTYCVSILCSDGDLFRAIQSRRPYAMVSYCLGSVSFLTVTVIGFDRFYAVKLRQSYRQVVAFSMMDFRNSLVFQLACQREYNRDYGHLFDFLLCYCNFSVPSKNLSCNTVSSTTHSSPIACLGTTGTKSVQYDPI